MGSEICASIQVASCVVHQTWNRSIVGCHTLAAREAKDSTLALREATALLLSSAADSLACEEHHDKLEWKSESAGQPMTSQHPVLASS